MRSFTNGGLLPVDATLGATPSASSLLPVRLASKGLILWRSNIKTRFACGFNECHARYGCRAFTSHALPKNLLCHLKLRATSFGWPLLKDELGSVVSVTDAEHLAWLARKDGDG